MFIAFQICINVWTIVSSWGGSFFGTTTYFASLYLISAWKGFWGTWNYDLKRVKAFALYSILDFFIITIMWLSSIDELGTRAETDCVESDDFDDCVFKFKIEKFISGAIGILMSAYLNVLVYSWWTQLYDTYRQYKDVRRDLEMGI